MEARPETAKEMMRLAFERWLKARKQILDAAHRKKRAKALMRRKRTQ